MPDTSLATTQPNRIEKPTPFSFAPTTFQEAIQFAERLSQSELVPKAFRSKPQDVLVAMQLGAEVGLAPMQSLKSIAVINGMPSLYGDGFLAVIMGHPAFEWIKEDNLADIEKNKAATCTIKRRGADPHTVTFTYDMAMKAGLFNKEGPWKLYTARQTQMRARGFCGRDTFADALRGISLYDEVADYQIIDVEPEKPRIQPTVQVPTATAEVKADEPKATERDPNSNVEIDEAKFVYDSYKKLGKTTDDFLEFGKGFEPNVTNSRQIKVKDLDKFKAWASTPKGEPVPPVSGNIFDAATESQENQDAEPA